MAAQSSPDPAVLMDELVEQFLLRLPPEDPADLACAALVSKQWHRVVTGAIFRCRYIEFHRSPPLLGYMLNLADSTRFIHISSFRQPHAHRCDVEAIHSSHGRVLLRPIGHWETDDIYLFVWDPITDKQWELPVLLSTPGSCISYWDAAVVCAVGDGCSLLTATSRSSSWEYTESGRWEYPESGRCLVFTHPRLIAGVIPSLLRGEEMVAILCRRVSSLGFGNDLYFWRKGSDVAVILFKYDLLTNQMCMISVHCEAQAQLTMGGLVIATGDGRLGVAKAINSTLCLWVKEQGRWAESRVIQLHALLPPEAAEGKPWVSGFAETGTGVIFLWTRVGLFAVDLNSGRSKKVREAFGSCHIFPS